MYTAKFSCLVLSVFFNENVYSKHPIEAKHSHPKNSNLSLKLSQILWDGSHFSGCELWICVLVLVVISIKNLNCSNERHWNLMACLIDGVLCEIFESLVQTVSALIICKHEIKSWMLPYCYICHPLFVKWFAAWWNV